MGARKLIGVRVRAVAHLNKTFDLLSAPASTCRTCAGEELIGARAWRVLFAGISLPLATIALFYFINHRYDGEILWTVRGLPHAHDAIFVANFVSFLFLYPSTFNLLEVAAVDKPKLHLWEAGVTRITRHPQACPHMGRLSMSHARWCIGAMGQDTCSMVAPRSCGQGARSPAASMIV